MIVDARKYDGNSSERLELTQRIRDRVTPVSAPTEEKMMEGYALEVSYAQVPKPNWGDDYVESW